jgi:hypothetical protein
MPDPGLMTSKMRAYMEALSPAARTMLLRAMRGAQERGEIDPSQQVILRAIAAFQGNGDRDRVDALPIKPPISLVPWNEQVRDAFFMPLQPFVSDLTYSTKIVARIQRQSLYGIWTYLKRDLAPAEFAKALSDETGLAEPDATLTARKLRREMTPRLAELIASGDTTSKPFRRLAAQLGSDMALHDLFDVVYIFQREGALLNFSGQLPRMLTAFELSDVGPVSELTKKTIVDLQVDPAFLAVLLLQRCRTAAGVAALAMTLAGSPDPKHVHASPYARIVDSVVAEAELSVYRFANHFRDRPTRLEALLHVREYHDLVRQLGLSLQPHHVPAWHKRLGTARKDISDLIAAEIEPLPGLIRRALRVESAAGGFGGQFDADAADDVEFGIRLLLEARAALDSLALNELVTKLRRQVEQTVEFAAGKLMANLKSDGAGDRADLLLAVDASIRMSAIVFGEEYAAILRKSRDITAVKPGKAATA